MNVEKLKTYAIELEDQFRTLAENDPEVKKLADALDQLINDAKQNKIAEPVDFSEVPGDYYFTEGNLGKYVELENAYAKFKLEVTGGETEQTKELLDMIKGIQKSD